MFHFIVDVAILIVVIKGLRWFISLFKGNGNSSYYDYNRHRHYSYHEPTKFIEDNSFKSTNENKWDNLFKG